MKEIIYTTYAEDTNITFILKDIYNNKNIISTEVIGFYFGSPDEEYTEEYKNRGLKAEF